MENIYFFEILNIHYYYFLKKPSKCDQEYFLEVIFLGSFVLPTKQKPYESLVIPFQLYWLSREGLYCCSACTYVSPVAIFYFLLYGCSNSCPANISNYPQQDIFHQSRFLKYKYTYKIRSSLIYT